MRHPPRSCPLEIMSSRENLRVADSRSDRHVPGAAIVDRIARTRVPSGSRASTSGRGVVKTPQLTYFKSDLRHICTWFPRLGGRAALLALRPGTRSESSVVVQRRPSLSGWQYARQGEIGLDALEQVAAGRGSTDA